MPLQICNYLLLSAFHICLLRCSSRSVCLRIAFECHFGVILLSDFLVVCHRYAYTHAPRLCTVAPGASLISQSYKYEVWGGAIHSLLAIAMRMCSYEAMASLARLMTEQRVACGTL